MSPIELSAELREILARNVSRIEKARLVAQAIRTHCGIRWVGIYDVDYEENVVRNIAWSGPSAPAYPIFPISSGITSRAIAEKRLVNVGDVSADADYLPALGASRSEMIVPVLDPTGDRVVGTLDVESDLPKAFGEEAEAMLRECVNSLTDLWHQRHSMG